MNKKRFLLFSVFSLIILSSLFLVNASPRSNGDLECNMKAEQIAKTMRAEREGLSLEDYGNLWNGYSSEDYATACITITTCGTDGDGCCAIVDALCSCVYGDPNITEPLPPPPEDDYPGPLRPVHHRPKRVVKAPTVPIIPPLTMAEYLAFTPHLKNPNGLLPTDPKFPKTPAFDPFNIPRRYEKKEDVKIETPVDKPLSLEEFIEKLREEKPESENNNMILDDEVQVIGVSSISSVGLNTPEDKDVFFLNSPHKEFSIRKLLDSLF